MFANAEAYERFMGRWSARLARPYLDFVRLPAGSRVLDVGCGTGAIAEVISGTKTPISVVGIDPVEGFVGYCRTRFTDPKYSFERGSALELAYSEATFDAAVSLLVLMLIPDPRKAASEMRRVTKPGGIVSACTWDGAGMEMSAIIWDEALKLDPSVAGKAERPKHCNAKGQLAALWRDVGLEDVEEGMIEMQTNFESFDDYWVPYLAGVGPTGGYVAALPEDRRESLANALRRRLLGDKPDGPISLGAKAWVVRGQVPER
ncbi:MAG: class I SAM-dependent methyltransferase [Betaproteobacteria bacterium]|nr:class I SAM-dependent methyltransferase [Betaproteobacteria bacterium]